MPQEFYAEAGHWTLQDFFLLLDESVKDGKIIAFCDTGLKDTLTVAGFNKIKLQTFTINNPDSLIYSIEVSAIECAPEYWSSVIKKTGCIGIRLYESVTVYFRTKELTDTMLFKGNLMPWLLKQSDYGVWDRPRIADEFSKQIEQLWQTTYERIKQGKIPVYSHLTFEPYENWEELWTWLHRSTTMCPDSFIKENINGTCFLLDPSLDQNRNHVLSWEYIGSTFSPCVGGIMLPENPMFYIKKEDFLKHCDEKPRRILEASLNALILDRMSRIFRADE